MTHSLQEEGQGGTGPSGIQCLKQNVRERQKTDPCGFSLGRSKTCGFVRGRPGPRGSGGHQGAGEGRTGDPPPAPRPWAPHGPAALAGGAPGRGGSGEACSHWPCWESEQAAALHPLPGSSSTPGDQNIQLWRTVVAWGPWPLLVP